MSALQGHIRVRRSFYINVSDTNLSYFHKNVYSQWTKTNREKQAEIKHIFSIDSGKIPVK